jgi:hypothetical protein
VSQRLGGYLRIGVGLDQSTSSIPVVQRLPLPLISGGRLPVQNEEVPPALHRCMRYTNATLRQDINLGPGLRVVHLSQPDSVNDGGGQVRLRMQNAMSTLNLGEADQRQRRHIFALTLPQVAIPTYGHNGPPQPDTIDKILTWTVSLSLDCLTSSCAAQECTLPSTAAVYWR